MIFVEGPKKFSAIHIAVDVEIFTVALGKICALYEVSSASVLFTATLRARISPLPLRCKLIVSGNALPSYAKRFLRGKPGTLHSVSVGRFVLVLL